MPLVGDKLSMYMFSANSVKTEAMCEQSLIKITTLNKLSNSGNSDECPKNAPEVSQNFFFLHLLNLSQFMYGFFLKSVQISLVANPFTLQH